MNCVIGIVCMYSMRFFYVSCCITGDGDVGGERYCIYNSIV